MLNLLKQFFLQCDSHIRTIIVFGLAIFILMILVEVAYGIADLLGLYWSESTKKIIYWICNTSMLIMFFIQVCSIFKGL